MKRGTIFILIIASLLFLAACSKSECETATDCTGRPTNAFTIACTDEKCVYTPKPGLCGNYLCETGETKGSCEVDCGKCEGKVPGSQYLFYTKVGNACVEEISTSQIKPVYSSADVSSAGDKVKIETVYNQPFNLKRDNFQLAFELTQQSPQNRDEHLIAAELTALTKDKRTITLARQNIDKYLWPGTKATQDLLLDFTTAEIEGELTDLTLKVQYEYNIVQAGKKTPKQGLLQNKYREKFVFAKPITNPPCPVSCDDKNQGTRDYCGVQTNFFCAHEPIPNTCGNYKCEGTETKCNCPQDCGPCTGSAGVFLDYTCQETTCTTILKIGATAQPASIFDDRSLGPVQLNNNYKYKNPFNIKTDKLTIDFKVYRQDPTVSTFIIETIRLLEGTEQLSETSVNQELGPETKTVEITIPSIADPEEEHTVNLAIWYKYTQGGQEKTGKFEKSLGKITLINPG